MQINPENAVQTIHAPDTYVFDSIEEAFYALPFKAAAIWTSMQLQMSSTPDMSDRHIITMNIDAAARAGGDRMEIYAALGSLTQVFVRSHREDGSVQYRSLAQSFEELHSAGEVPLTMILIVPPIDDLDTLHDLASTRKGH